MKRFIAQFPCVANRLVPLLMVCLLSAVMWLPAKANVPLAVGLTSFDAFPLNNAVRLTWSTGTEVNTVAFVVKRSSGNSPFALLTNLGFGGYIVANGGPSIGADYDVTDDTAVNGITYTYKLFEIEANTNEVELATVTVTAGIPTPTPSPTPIVISGGQTPLPSATRSLVTPSATAAAPTGVPPSIPTATPMPASNNTPIATVLAPGMPTDSSAGQPASGGGPASTSQAASGTSVNEPIEAGAGESAPAEGTGPLDGIEVAAALSETGGPAEEGYPVPSLVPTFQIEDNAYPSVPGALSVTETPPAYLAETPSSGNEDLTVIGDQSEALRVPEEDKPTDGQGLVGRIYLWIGFIVALLIFVAAVFGSIVLFTRRRE